MAFTEKNMLPCYPLAPPIYPIFFHPTLESSFNFATIAVNFSDRPMFRLLAGK